MINETILIVNDVHHHGSHQTPVMLQHQIDAFGAMATHRRLYHHGSKGYISVSLPLKFQSDPLCNLAVS